MARMFPAVYAPLNGDATVADRRLFARLQRELDGNWQAIHDAALGFILLHRDLGIAIVAPRGRIEPGAAVIAMRARLGEIGFSRNFQGGIAVVAESLDPEDRRDLVAVLAAEFNAVAPATPTDPTWPDWLLQRLLPVPEETEPRRAAVSAALRGPEPEESWRAEAAATPARDRDTAVRVVPERRLHAQDLDTRSPLWAGMALAVFVVAVVLAGMALLSHGNDPGPHPPAGKSPR
jgi:hypothetical protein